MISRKKANNSFISQSSPLLLSNFARKSFPTHKSSKLPEFLLLTFEYLQLVSQSILLYPRFSDSSLVASKPILNGFLYAAKLVNPSSFLSFDEDYSTTKIALIGVFIFAILKYFVFAFFFVLALRDNKQISKTNTFWRWAFQIQGRVLYFWTTSFWIGCLFAAFRKEFEFHGMNKSTIIVLCFIFIITEFLLTITMEVLGCYFLPQKNLLARKDNTMEVVTLTQKVVLQFFQIMLPWNTPGQIWTVLTITTLFHFVRSYHFLSTIPLYKMQALSLQAILLIIVTSLNLSLILNEIFESVNSDFVNEGFVIVNWVLMLVLSVRIAHNLFSSQILKLMTTNQQVNPKFLVHRIHILKQLRKANVAPGTFPDKYRMSYFLSITVNKKIFKAFNVTSEDLDFNPTDKGSYNQINLRYLEKAIERFPKNKFLKLYAAYFYAKKLKLYGKAVKIILELQKENSVFSFSGFNALLLMQKIEASLRLDYKRERDSVDLDLYIQCHGALQKLKKAIHQQAERQIQICKEIANEDSNPKKIFQNAQSITKLRSVINRRIQELNKISPDYFLQPLMLCANYYSILNYSHTDHSHFLKIYNQKNSNYEKCWQKSMTHKNIFQDTCAFFIISGQKSDAGTIIHCNQQVANLLGGDANSYIGSNISSLFLPKVEGFIDEFFKMTTQSGNANTASIKNTGNRFVKNKNGFMINVDYYINIYPLLTRGFYLSVIMRPTPTNTSYILLHPNGEIEGVSEKIIRDLNVYSSSSSQKGLNISMISAEITRANAALNFRRTKFRNSSILKNQLSIEDSASTESRTNEPTSRKTSRVRKSTFFASHELEVHSQNSPLISPRDVFKSNLEEALQLSQDFSNDGREIILSPLQNRKESGTANNRQSFRYHCKMENLTMGGTTMRLISLDTLTKNERRKTLERTIADTRRKDSLFSNPCKIVSLGIPHFDLDKFPENFKIEDEKYEGWIDFKGMHSGVLDSTVDHQILSPMINPIQRPDPMVRLPTDPFDSHPFDSHPLDSHPLDSHRPILQNYQVKSSDDTLKSEPHDPKVFNQKVEGSIATSQRSKISFHLRLSKAYESAMITKYHSKSTFVWIVVFYLVLLGLILAQIYMKVLFDQTGETIDAKKNVLIQAHFRTYYLANLQTFLRQLRDIGTERVLQAELGMIARPLSSYLQTSTEYLSSLIRTNRNILQKTDQLEPDIRNLLFSNNVRIWTLNETTFEPEKYSFMTNFHGTQTIIETAFKQIDKITEDPIAGQLEFEFILRNSLNDLYTENEKISDVFLESAMNQIGFLEIFMRLYIGLTIGLMFASTLIIAVLLWRKYRKIKKIMFAFLRLNESKIKNVQAKLENFKNALETETAYVRFYKWELFGQEKSEQISPTRKPRKDIQIKILKFFEIQKRSIFLSISWLVLISGVIIFIVYRVMLTYELMDQHNFTIIHLEKVIKMMTEVNIAVIAISELLIPGGGVELIKNEPIEKQVIKSLESFVGMRSEINKNFIQKNGLGIEAVQHQLFDEFCDQSKEMFELYCATLQRDSISSNFVHLMSALENLVRSKYEDYLASDKSETSLHAIEIEKFDTLISLKRVLLDKILQIGKGIDNTYYEYLERTNKERSDVLISSLVYLIFLGLLAWSLILRKVRSVNNQLKRVLRTIPPDLIFSSFILKKFLIKTAEGTLDYVRDQL